MKAWISNHGRTVGGVCAIASAAAYWIDLKFLAGGLASCAVAFVVSTESARKVTLRSNGRNNSPAQAGIRSDAD